MEDDFDYGCEERGYTPVKERWYQVSIWVLACLIFGGLTIFTLSIFMKEELTMHNGVSMEVPYTFENVAVAFTTEDNHRYYVDIAGAPIRSNGDTVTVYYYPGKEDKAVIQTKAWYWVVTLGGFGCGLALSVAKCIKHFKRVNYEQVS